MPLRSATCSRYGYRIIVIVVVVVGYGYDVYSLMYSEFKRVNRFPPQTVVFPYSCYCSLSSNGNAICSVCAFLHCTLIALSSHYRIIYSFLGVVQESCKPQLGTCTISAVCGGTAGRKEELRERRDDDLPHATRSEPRRAFGSGGLPGRVV